MKTTGLELISTKDMSREEWLAERRKAIGGSDAAGIIGISEWSTPYSVWADKMGKLDDLEDKESMRIGRDLEAYVASRFEEATGKKVHRLNAMIRNPKYPWASANIDRAISGEEAILECKTTSTLDVQQFKNVDFPTKYYAQCVHYMAVTGAERVYLAVLHFGRGFYTYTLERDQAEIDALMAAEADFWKYVETGTEPPVDGKDPTSDALKTVYAESTPGKATELFGREYKLNELFAKKAEIAKLEEEITEIENLIKDDMKDAEKAVCGAYKVSWKTQVSNRFNKDMLAADHPEINLNQYTKPSISRPLKITKSKTA